MSENTLPPVAQDENQLILERREKLKAIRKKQAEGKGVAFPNDFKPTDHAAGLFERFNSKTTEELAALGVTSLGNATPLPSACCWRMALSFSRRSRISWFSSWATGGR